MLANDIGNAPVTLLLLSLLNPVETICTLDFKQIETMLEFMWNDLKCLQVLEAFQVTQRGGNSPGQEVAGNIKSLKF